jgi:hypothetical protein
VRVGFLVVKENSNGLSACAARQPPLQTAFTLHVSPRHPRNPHLVQAHAVKGQLGRVDGQHFGVSLSRFFRLSARRRLKNKDGKTTARGGGELDQGDDAREVCVRGAPGTSARPCASAGEGRAPAATKEKSFALTRREHSHAGKKKRNKMRKFLSSLDLEPSAAGPSGGATAAGETGRKRPAAALLPGGQARLRDCAKVVVLDRRDDPATTAAGLLPLLTTPAENADPSRQLDALRTLACIRVDRGLLASTGVGAAVRRLKRSPHVEVAVVRCFFFFIFFRFLPLPLSLPLTTTPSAPPRLHYNTTVGRPPGGQVEGPGPGRAGGGAAGGQGRGRRRGWRGWVRERMGVMGLPSPVPPASLGSSERVRETD